MSSSRPAAQGPAGGRRLLPVVLAALSLLSSVAFVLAPVERTEAVYGWPSAPGDATAVAVPLMTEHPAELTATIGCAAARAAPPGTVLLTTAAPGQAAGDDELAGLRVAVTDDGLEISSGGTDLDPQPIPGSGGCSWRLVSTPDATTLLRDGQPVQELAGDHRPDVAGVFSEVDDPEGLAVDVTADTVFQTSPTPLKAGLGALALLTLAGALVLLHRRERGSVPVPVAEPRLPGRGLRRVVDALVVVGLAGWTLIGSMTVDDGYISGIVRSRDANGYIGNVHRWFNAPEAPFGWFYEFFDLWSEISPSTLWMRVPSSLLGIATWFLISRGLLPRLGAFAASRWSHAVAAVAFALWWLPTNLGLRPEPWVATGLAAVMVLVERGLRRGRPTPLLVGLGIAGVTLAVTPTGAVAFLPFLAAAVPVLRLARRSATGLPALVVVAAASTAAALLLMFADQSLTGVLEANRIRGTLPGTVPWSAEPERWYNLLSNGDLQGSLGRRVPVLLAVVAAVAIVWQRLSGTWPASVDRSAAGRLVGTFGLSLLVLLATPTKWTMHFSALVPVGVGLVVVAVHLFGRPVGAPVTGPRIPVGAVARHTVGTVVVLLVGALSWAGLNTWAYLSNRDVPGSVEPPVLGPVSVSTLLLGLAVLVAAGGAVLVVRARTRDEDDVRLPGARFLPSTGAVAVGLALLTIALQVGGFLQSTWSQRGSYSMASDAANTLRGEPCGLTQELAVETDPRAGLLPPAGTGAAALDGFTEVRDGGTPVGPDLAMAGTGLPGWVARTPTADDAAPATLVTGWFRLPSGFAEGDLPLVVTTSGTRGPATALDAEFGRADGGGVDVLESVPVPDIGGAPAVRDGRVLPDAVPAGADVVRLVAEDGGDEDDLPLAVSAPRVPVTEPFAEVVDPDAPVIVDWPVGFVFPCQTVAVQQHGITDVPGWRIASPLPDVGGEIVVQRFFGGPYAPARTLVDQVEVPVYELTRPHGRPITLYAWEPRFDLEQPQRRLTTTTVPGWSG